MRDIKESGEKMIKVPSHIVVEKTRQLLAQKRLTMKNLQAELGYKLTWVRKAALEKASNKTKIHILQILEKYPALMEEIKGQKKRPREYHEFFRQMPHEFTSEYLLAEIERNPKITYSGLANKLMIDKLTATRLVKELAEKGSETAADFARCASARRGPPGKIPDPIDLILQMARSGAEREKIVKELIKNGYCKRRTSHLLKDATRDERFSKLEKRQQKTIWKTLRRH